MTLQPEYINTVLLTCIELLIKQLTLFVIVGVTYLIWSIKDTYIHTFLYLYYCSISQSFLKKPPMLKPIVMWINLTIFRLAQVFHFVTNMAIGSLNSFSRPQSLSNCGQCILLYNYHLCSQSIFLSMTFCDTINDLRSFHSFFSFLLSLSYLILLTYSIYISSHENIKSSFKTCKSFFLTNWKCSKLKQAFGAE